MGWEGEGATKIGRVSEGNVENKQRWSTKKEETPGTFFPERLSFARSSFFPSRSVCYIKYLVSIYIERRPHNVCI